MSTITLANLPEPLARFHEWWTERRRVDPGDGSSAMVVSSVDGAGRPSSRVVLLRGFDVRGFVFYTNLDSKKGRELLQQKVAALNFHWPASPTSTPPRPARQVRVEGNVERVDDEEADAYFQGRPRDSQLGAWASDQSRPLESREQLLARVEEIRVRFPGEIPRPPRWSGLRVIPVALELWEEGAFRLHNRERYELSDGVWTRILLFP